MAHIEIREMSYTFDKNHQPVATVQPGDTITFNTVDCFSNQIKSEKDLVTSVDFDRVNPGTGPVYIEGAEPGDVLVVEIENIEVANQGVGLTYDVGALKEHSELRTKIIPIDIKNGVARFNDIDIPLRPMIGVIGVAPAGDAIGCGRIGDHGGNMDNTKIEKGAKLYFPVNTPGALLQIGDLHGAMGDGELSGAGLEVAGAATVKVELIKDFKLNRPLIETTDRWYTTAARDTYSEALKLAMQDLQELMLKPYGWDHTDIDIYLSIDGHVEVNQGCDLDAMQISLRVGIPKIDGRELISF